MQTETNERHEMTDHDMIALAGGGVRPAQEGERERLDEFEAEMRERERRSVEEADAAGASHILCDLEETIRRAERGAKTLRLVASIDGIDDDVSDSMYLLADTLEADIEKIQAEVQLAHEKLWAFGRGFMRAVEVDRPKEGVAFTKEMLDRLQCFVDEQRPHQINETE